MLEPGRWSVVQKLQALSRGLTVEHLMTFIQGLKDEMYVEGLVQGNFTSQVSQSVGVSQRVSQRVNH